jgi:hypothetical protein
MTARASAQHGAQIGKGSQKVGALASDTAIGSHNEGERLRRLTTPLGATRRPRDLEQKTPQSKNKLGHSATQHASIGARAAQLSSRSQKEPFVSKRYERLEQDVRTQKEAFTGVAERQRKIEEELRMRRLEESQRLDVLAEMVRLRRNGSADRLDKVALAGMEDRPKKELRSLRAERVVAAEQRQGEARFQLLEEKVALMEGRLDQKEARIRALESGQQCTPCKAVPTKDGGHDKTNVFAELLPVMDIQASSARECAREPGTPSVRDLVKNFEKTPVRTVPFTPPPRRLVCGGDLGRR